MTIGLKALSQRAADFVRAAFRSGKAYQAVNIVSLNTSRHAKVPKALKPRSVLQVRRRCAPSAAQLRHRCDAEQICKTGQTSGAPNRGKCQVFIRIKDSWKNLRVTPAVSAVNTDFANPQCAPTATHLRRKCGPGAA